MKARFPNGLEAEGPPAELVEFVAALTERLKNAPPALAAPTPSDSGSPVRSETDAGVGVRVPDENVVKAANSTTPPAEAESRTGVVPVSNLRADEDPGHSGTACPVCKRTFTTPHGLAVHARRSHQGVFVTESGSTITFEGVEPEVAGNEGEKEDYRPTPSPDLGSQPATTIRLTDKICASAVDATFDGKTLAAWVEVYRFRGNMNALIPWVNMVVRATNRMAWKAMSENDKARFVLRAIGGKINETALSGGT